MSKKGQSSGSLFNHEHDGNGANSFDWISVDTGRLQEIIGIVTARGGAIRLGYSRDGSAGSIGLYYGDNRDTLYIRPNGDVEEVFGLIERTFKAFPLTGGKAPK